MAQEPTEFNWGNVGKKPPAASIPSVDGIEQPLANGRFAGREVHDVPPEPKAGSSATSEINEPGFNWGNVKPIDQSQKDIAPNWSPSKGDSVRAEPHPVESRLNSLVNDIKFGPGSNDDRLPERLMRAIGFKGTQSGTSGNPGAMMPIVGAVEGVPEVAHAISETPQIDSAKGAQRVFNEGAGGAFKTLAGVGGVTHPLSVIPAMARALPAYAAGSGAASAAGGDPDTQQFVGNLAAGALPAERAVADKVGSTVGPPLINNAGKIGTALGYLGTAGKVGLDLFNGKVPNPLDLIFASPLGTKPATAAVKGAGELLNSGAKEPMIIQPPGPVDEPLIKTEPKQLGSGSIRLPEGQDEGIQTPRAQAQVVRGKGGRMTKQFTTSPDSGKTQFGTEKPLIQTNFGEPQAPPNAAGTTDVGPFRQGGAEPPPGTEAKTESRLDQTNRTVDSIIDNLKQAVELNTHEEDADSMARKAQYEKELGEWQDFKDSINQPGYNNPHIDLNEQVPVKESMQPVDESSAVKDIEKPAPFDELNNPGRRSTDTTPDPNRQVGHKLIDNNLGRRSSDKDIKDTEEKGLQQDLRNQFDRDQEAADEHGRKLFYRGMKIGYHPDVETPQPFGQNPFDLIRR